ncbi:hypothetical protein [Butyrivibrio sp. AE3004]|uniref:hypothetical protein n=1 Tax=Butyrivibrio sp. AE3004 TaxID=1506994 RepID=UPI000493BE26|nr:hypothetical protein [Butyrivibrio sp. AE3004]
MSKESNKVYFTLNTISALALVFMGIMYWVEDGLQSSSTITTITLGVIYGCIAFSHFRKYKKMLKIKARSDI